MNNTRLHYLWITLVFNLLLTGCFGGKAPVVRAESQQRAETALTRGVRAQQKGNFPESKVLLTEAFTISSSIEDYPLRITALVNLARLHRLQHDLSNSEIYIDQALVLLQSDSRLSADVSYEKALLEISKGNLSKALEWAHQAIASEQGNQQGARRNLASRIQLALGNWSDADILARSALIENRSAGHAEEEANSLRIMGIVARNERKYTEAERLLREALSIDKRVGRSAKIAMDLEELASTSQRAGNTTDYADYLVRAYDVNLAADQLQQARHNQEELAEIYSLLGDLFKAAAARETARKLEVKDASQQPQGSSVTIKPSNKP